MKTGEKMCCIFRILLIAIVVLAVRTAYPQSHTLTFKVVDAEKIPIGNATVKINRLEQSADSSGAIIAILPSGRHHIAVSSVGYFPFSRSILLNNDTSLLVVLQPRESLLQNVTISASRNIMRNQMSTHILDMAQIQKLPVVLGEVDPLKIVTLLPGIKGSGESSAGMYVRGGGPDQNLVLLDGITVYNPNHLLGFFSVFNGDAVKNVEVIKGGMPAEYGGRLSSVISVTTREGNKDSLKVSGGIGLISSRLSLEGPIVKKKLTFIISARRTYIDQLARLVVPGKIGQNAYYFYDFNGRADYRVNRKNTLSFTFYSGRDDFKFQDDYSEFLGREFNALWGNTIFGLTWKLQLNNRWKQELSVVRNNFNLSSRIFYSTSSFVLSSGLTDYQVKNDWVYTPHRWIRWKTGVQYTLHSFRPGAGNSTVGIQDFKSQINDQHAREAAAYISTDINVTPRLNLVAGFRYSYFNQVGPTERVLYGANGAPTGETESFKKGESIARYQYPEPRISVLYKTSNASSIKMSYTRTTQYLHLATTSAATFPSDLWVPVSRLIRPGRAEQVAAGFFKGFGKGRYEISMEAYYKTMTNQLEFKPGAQLLLNQNIEGEMVFGSGKAYGIEFFLQKKKGKLNGWIGYTLSRTTRTFPGMNDGKPFPYRYDRTHDMSLVLNYRFNRHWEASTVFVYGTGNALTMPTGRFAYDMGYDPRNMVPILTNVNQYDRINDYRMPPYHRLDLAFTFTPRPRTTKRYKSSWVFSLYNVYNRYNPYFIYLYADEDEGVIQGKQVYLFPITPGITWNFKF
ncbi:TonB-dependent receptor [Flavihumibacter solisilvae]|nr:TonB-dependent receptor [Flavihumibacter solisilvae]